MRITKASLAIDIAALLIILVLVEWLATTLTHTRNFWPLVLIWSIYLAARVAIAARKPRSSQPGNSN
jgi:hypothetical protein